MVKAVILVGGPNKGTRFRPLSLELPKPLFEVAGRPMIYHQIEACARLPNLQEVILLGFYNDSDFSKFVQDTSKELSIKIRYLNEGKVLGTAGGLYLFRSEILSGDPEAIFVMNSDICCSFPLEDILRFHSAHGKDGTIMATTVPKEHALHYGSIVHDPITTELVHYAEKPETFVSDLINCGIYCLAPTFFGMIETVLQEMQQKHEAERVEFMASIGDLTLDRSMLPPTLDSMRLEQDLFERLAGTKRIHVFKYSGFWRAIKNAGGAVYCQELYLKYYAQTKPHLLARPSANITGSVIIHPTAQVHPTAKIGPFVTIGANAKIGEGVRIANSIVLEGCEVKSHACILFSILGWHTVVGMWARVEGIPNYSPFLYTTQKQRQGITIIAKGSTVRGEVIVRNCIVMPMKQLEHSYYDEILL